MFKFGVGDEIGCLESQILAYNGGFELAGEIF